MNLNSVSPTPKEPEDILVVDDKPENIRLLSAMLKDQGYKVRKAIDGEMALEAVKTAIPDLMLLDITMPNMNGYQVCQRLKADSETAEIPVIFISALDEVFDKVKAFAVGGVDYITKPFSEEEVFLRVESQLKIIRLKKELQSKNIQLEQEIRDRVSAEMALRLSEERFAKAFNANPNPITITSLEDGKHLLVNQSFLKVTGYTQAEVEGKTALDLNLWVNLEDRQHLFEVLEKQHSVHNYKFQFCTRSGEVRTALLSAEMIDLSGQDCLLSISDDITERERAELALQANEAKYRHIFNNSQIGIFRTRIEDGLFLEVNQRLVEMIGYSQVEEIIHQKYSTDFYVRSEERQEMLKQIQAQGEIRNFKTQFKRKDGSIFWGLFSAKVNQQYNCLDGVINDISSSTV
ncbi:MAG: PAS domain S-box protein [Cyanobacteriota bacterium]|nr:PAS domain S-box protein [Cyanobacteriota bacterium]